jgi:hypothetical protein
MQPKPTVLQVYHVRFDLFQNSNENESFFDLLFVDSGTSKQKISQTLSGIGPVGVNSID